MGLRGGPRRGVLPCGGRDNGSLHRRDLRRGDSKTSVEVMNLLTDLNRTEKVTIIVVTHESGVANCTDKIIHIKDGIIGETTMNEQHKASVFGTSTIMK